MKENVSCKKVVVLVAVLVVIAAAVLTIGIYQLHTSPKSSFYIYPDNGSEVLLHTNNFGLLEGSGGVNGLPVNLTWPAHIGGTIISDKPVYFYITYSFKGIGTGSNNTSDDKNISTYFVGPSKDIYVSVLLPPGLWTFWFQSVNSGITNVSHVYLYANYSYYSPAQFAIYGVWPADSIFGINNHSTCMKDIL